LTLYKTSKFKLSWKELLQNHLLDSWVVELIGGL
jgi:hypothetical protein